MGIPTIIKLSGVSFCQDVINTLNEKDELILELEPDNKYDINAIKVLFNNNLCGYIPKKYKINDEEIILNELIKKKFTKISTKYSIQVKKLYKWEGPTGIEIEFLKK